MSALLRLYRLAVALAVAVAGPAWAQKGLPEPPAPRGASGGIGIHLDLGTLLRTLATRRPAGQFEEVVPGQIVGVWDVNEALDPEMLARMADARPLEAQRWTPWPWCWPSWRYRRSEPTRPWRPYARTSPRRCSDRR